MQCRFCSNTNEAEIRNVPANFFGQVTNAKVTVPTCVTCYLEMFTEGCSMSEAKGACREFLRNKN